MAIGKDVFVKLVGHIDADQSRHASQPEFFLTSRPYHEPRIFDQKVQLVGREFRQIFIADLVHEEPTILLTNQATYSSSGWVTRFYSFARNSYPHPTIRA